MTYRFSWGLGMPLVAKSDHSTGNSSFASYVLKSDDLTFIFSAPYSRQAAPADTSPAVPSFNMDTMYSFVNRHGLGVRAVGEQLLLRTMHFTMAGILTSQHATVICSCAAPAVQLLRNQMLRD